MGLAPYGQPDSLQVNQIKRKITESLVDIKDDGSIFLNMDYFDYATGLRMTHNRKWEELFGIPPRKPESEITQDYMNMALAIQQIIEEIIIRLARHAKDITGCTNLTLAGGVALNCVANGKILQTGLFNDIWIQPAAGDAGGALGAALAAWHITMGKPRIPSSPDCMNGSYLGPEYTDKEISRAINKYNAKSTYFEDFGSLCEDVASYLDEGSIIGWFQGRMEFGPRALGNRSILGDARNPEMQKKLNLKIKYREGFRPFAPAVLEEDIQTYFGQSQASSYMLFVAPVNTERRTQEPESYLESSLMQRLYHLRSDIPTVTHIDYSARVQSVHATTNPRLHLLISKFKELTQYGVIVNTSFNVRGEPIVCTPDDAYLCFMSTEMDYLVLGNFLFRKEDQPTIANLKKGAKAND